MMRFLSGILALALAVMMLLVPAGAENEGGERPVLLLRVAEYGDIYVELYPEHAPVTVENFLALVDRGFYNGLTFHRIISGFMAQGGCPLGNGTGGSGANIKGEFSANGVDNPLKHERGVLSMARSSDPNSASSQFFIMHAAAPHLDGSYAAFGRVISGMGVVDAICRTAHVTDQNGTVPGEDQPVISQIVRAERSDADLAALQEAQNGREGGTFDDPTSGLTFPVADHWNMVSCANGEAAFSNGESVFYLSSLDIWRQMGKTAQARYTSAGYPRDRLTTAAIRRSLFSSVVGVAEEQLAEATVTGRLWLTATVERDGRRMRCYTGAVNGTLIMLMGDESVSNSMESVLATLTVE